MLPKTKVIFRADGNSRIGLGHVVRSQALAELLMPEFECIFAIQEPSATLESQLKTVAKTLEKLPVTNSETELLAEAEKLVKNLSGNEIIVLDGYQFSTAYQEILKQKSNILVCLDDLHDRFFFADAIINIAGGVSPAAYQTAPYTKLYLGPQYALLRKPFLEAQKTLGETAEKAKKILLCFGGADPENYTLQYANKIAALKPAFQLEIVIGSAYQHEVALQQSIANNKNISLHKNLSAEAMAGVMQACEAAICSASSVAYEYCAVNGMLFVEKTAANQTDLYNYLISQNLALPAEGIADFLTSANQAQTEKFVLAQRQVFNGQAPENLLNLFRQLEILARLQFRKVAITDAELLYVWANDPVVRQFSFNPEPIPYQTHLNWLNGKLSDPNALVLLAEIAAEPVALLRFDCKENTVLISYQIGAAYRGKGLGHRVLQVGLKELRSFFPAITEAVGFVQPVNIASVRAFEKAAFENLGLDSEHQAFKFSKKIA